LSLRDEKLGRMFFVLVFCLGVGRILCTDTSDSEETPSKATSGFLKSSSAGKHLSHSSSFGSEDFSSPEIPGDFHEKFGANKSWHPRTPHPIISRRASYEDYGRHMQPHKSEDDDDDDSWFRSSSVSKKTPEELASKEE